METCNGCNDDPDRDDMIDEGYASGCSPRTGCPIESKTAAPPGADAGISLRTIATNGTFCTPWTIAYVGETLHARGAYETEGTGNPSNFGMWIERDLNGIISQAAFAAGDNSNRFTSLDFTVPASPQHNVHDVRFRACIRKMDYAVGWAFLRLEIAGATCGGAGTCFGAVGDNCKHCSLFADGSPSPWDARGVDCQFTLGSAEHDTCCSHDRYGYMCTPGGGTACTGEFARAVHNEAITTIIPLYFVKGGYTKRVEPTITTYEPADLVQLSREYPGTYAMGLPYPTVPYAPWTLLYPAGTAIDGEHWGVADAIRWCASGQYHIDNLTPWLLWCD